MNVLEPNALIVLPTGIKGGAESVAFSLARELDARGWTVIFYVMSRGWQPELRKLADLSNVRVIAREFRSEKASVVSVMWDLIRLSRRYPLTLAYSTHLHVNAMLGVMRRAGALPVKRLVARESTQIFERFRGAKRLLFWLMYRVGYGPQDLLILQTPEMLASLCAALGRVPVARCEVLPNPVDTSYVAACLAGAAMIRPGRRRVVACGRLVEIKGFGKLIAAFTAISHQFPDYQLELIGAGPLEAQLRQEVASHAPERVVFHGALDNPFPVLFGADVGVISSEREGFPNVLLEMMACSVRRIVSTPCTDAVAGIPNLLISRSADAGDIGVALSAAMASQADHSDHYRAFVNRMHSPTSFADKVAGNAAAR